jgi:hypothetical protein
MRYGTGTGIAGTAVFVTRRLAVRERRTEEHAEETLAEVRK